MEAITLSRGVPTAVHRSLVFGCLRSEARRPQRRPVAEDTGETGEDVGLLVVRARHVSWDDEGKKRTVYSWEDWR